jgi:glutamate N-acetyltransferase / amino-acid N-acetyltransferase
MSFFRSRWVDAPAHAGELHPTALPRGFRAAGVAAGIKPEGLDVGVLASDAPETVSAARFTTNARVGAPVIVSREAELHGLRAVAVNSGCSNVGAGGSRPPSPCRRRLRASSGCSPARLALPPPA